MTEREGGGRDGDPDDVAAKVRAEGGMADSQVVGDSEGAVKWMAASMRPSTSAGVRCSRVRSSRFGGRPAGRPLATVRFSGSGVTSFRRGIMRKSFGSILPLCFITKKAQDHFTVSARNVASSRLAP